MLKYFIVAIILIALPGSSFAEGLDFTPAAHDLSLNYLRAIFENIEGVLVSGGTQILGRMFNIFNSAVLSIGGIILMYILIISTINTAQSGEVMGKTWSSIWIPMRASLGIALLVPKASGYCTAQAILMWLILQGIGVANSLWGEALDYLSQGGSLVNVDVGVGSGMKENAPGQVQKAKDYLKLVTCSLSLQERLENQVENREENLLLHLDTAYTWTADEATWLYEKAEHGRDVARFKIILDNYTRELPQNKIDVKKYKIDFKLYEEAFNKYNTVLLPAYLADPTLAEPIEPVEPSVVTALIDPSPDDPGLFTTKLRAKPSPYPESDIIKELDDLPIIPSFIDNISISESYENRDKKKGLYKVRFPNQTYNNDRSKEYAAMYADKCGTVTIAITDKTGADKVKMLANEQLLSSMTTIATEYVESGYDDLEDEDTAIANAATQYYLTMRGWGAIF